MPSLWRQVHNIQSIEKIPISRDNMKRKKDLLIPKNGICSLESVRDHDFAFLHEQAGNDADDTNEEAVDAHQQD